MMVRNRKVEESCQQKWASVSERTGKGQFSFQSQRTAMPKNAQTYHTTAFISHTSNAQNSPSQTSKVPEP